MSIKTYTSIAESYNISNFFDIYDEDFNKIRFSIKNQHLYITSYNPDTGVWSPASVIFDTSPIQTTSLIDFQDILNSSNTRIQLDASLEINGKEILIFEKDGNYNYIKRSGLNYAIDSSPYIPTVNLDDRIVVYRLDSNGDPQFTLSQMSTTAFAALFVTLADNQTISGVKKFNANTLKLGGVGGDIILRGSQVSSSSSYTLELPTAAPSGTLNVLTTSGTSPYSKLTWTDLSLYAALSAFDQLTNLNTTGSPSFANLTITSGGALNLNYMSTPASSDILATLNTNKQLTNSGVSLSNLCTLNSAQTITADKTFNYSAGKIKLSNYSTDNTSTNNFLTVNASGYLVPCNKLYSDMVDISSVQTISGAKTLSGATTLSSTVTLSGVNSDTATSSGQKLAVLNTTSNALQRINITADTLVTTSSGTQTIAGNKTLSGATTLSSTVTLSGVNSDTATSSGQKLAVLNTTSNAVERINITPDTIIMTTGAQTITGIKTYDYTTSKIALTNTTNDNTTTNKVLVLNASNQIVTCDKTYASIGSGGGGGSTVYNGYAALSSSVGNKRTSIIVTNPLSSASITVTANVSKTLDGDGNYVQFDNVLTTITSSYITFYISAVTEWIVDTTNTYTLFYSAMANPGTNPTYSAETVAIPNLYAYVSFETGTATDVYSKMTFSDLNANSTVTTSNKKWGSYALQMGNGYTIGMNSTNYGVLNGNFTLAFWYRTPSTSNPPNLQMNFGLNANTALLAVSQGTTPATMKFTSWGGYTVPSPAAMSLDTNFHHYTIVINSASSTCQFYMDGVLLINMPISNLANGGVGTYLSWYMYDNFFPQVDDIRIYSRCLTVSEALSLTTINPSGILSSSYSSVVIPNVVSYWNFNSNVTDQVGTQAFTGTPTYNTSIFKYGTAAVNSTSASLVTTLSSYASNYGISLSFWLYNITNAPITINPAALTELNINTTGKTSTAIQIGISGGTLSTAQYSSTLQYSASKWWHVVMIIDFSQKTLRLFYNGILAFIYTGTDSYFAAASWTAPVISLNKNGSANIDELRVYNRILTETEVGYLYTYAPTSIYALAAPLTTTLSASTSNDTLVAINSSGTLTNSAIAFSSLSELNNIPKIPIYHFKFEQNLNSSGSSSYGGASTGTFTYNASGKYGYCVETAGALTSALTGLNTSSGNSATICGWININATSNSLRIRLGGAFNLYLMMYNDSGRSVTTFNNCFYLNEVSGYSASYNFGLNNPDFSQSANINKWWFFSYTWDSANKTLGLYFSDGGANTYSTTRVYTSGDSTFTNALNTKFRDITTVDFVYTTSGTFIDNLKIYNTVLSSTELAALATASTPDAINPSVIFNTTTQTISGAKTFDCSTGALALTNTTNDTTTTNKILTLNTSTNKVTPCDKTYADVFKPRTVDIYDSVGTSYARLLINGGALSIQYYLNGTISGSPYALTVPVIIAPTPVLAWNFNTNLSSTYSTSGTYTFSGGSVTSGGKFGSCWQNFSGATITADMTPYTRASGNSFTFSCWFKYNASSGGGGIRINFLNNNQSRIWVALADAQLVYIDDYNGSDGTVSLFTKTAYNFPTFSSGTNYEAWTFFAYSWEDSTSTFSFVMYVNGTKYSGSQVITNSNTITYIRRSTRYNSALGTSPIISMEYCTNSVRFDDFRIWARALTEGEIAMVYNTTTDTI